MTEQERFERWNKSCEWFRDYHGNSTEEDILNFDEENKCYHYSTQQKCWEAWQAAQQKEGYVPVAAIREAVIAGWELSADGHNNEYCTSSQGELNYLFDQAVEYVLKAAQEVE